jgi:L-seryl-tRNA(Ser) seleniumtransferase
MECSNQLRLLPSIDELLQSPQGQELINHYSRLMTLQAMRASLAQAREDIRSGAMCPSPEQLLQVTEQLLQEKQQPQLRP